MGLYLVASFTFVFDVYTAVKYNQGQNKANNEVYLWERSKLKDVI